MAHWRDGGIGNMAGSDDRPIEEWTLLEKLADLAGGSGDMPDKIAQEAFDEIERLREALAVIPQWQPIDTAPVEPFEKVPEYYRFRCLLQEAPARGESYVSEGYGRYVKVGRATTHKTLRWYNSMGQCFPKYWMPLPAPMVTP